MILFQITGLAGHPPTRPCPKENLIAGLFGFGVVSSSFMGVAKILFVVFLILAVLSFLGGGYRRGRSGA